MFVGFYVANKRFSRKFILNYKSKYKTVEKFCYLYLQSTQILLEK